MLRRIQIQTENVGRFAFELGIVAGQVTLQTVGFETGLLPDSMDGVFADSQSGCQFATAPMRRSIARLLAGGRQNPGSRKRCFQRMMVGAVVCSCRLIVLNDAPSASIRISLARKT
jgi:hypothetical protein